MTRSRLAFATFAMSLFVCGSLIAADKQPAKAERSTFEFRRLRGTWKIVSSKDGGKERKTDIGILWIFDGRKLFLGARNKKSKPMIVSIDVDKHPREMAWDIPMLRLPKNWKDRPPLGLRGRKNNVEKLPILELTVPKLARFGYRIDGDTLIVAFKIKTERVGRQIRMRYVVPESLASSDGKHYLVLHRVERPPVVAPRPRATTRP